MIAIYRITNTTNDEYAYVGRTHEPHQRLRQFWEKTKALLRFKEHPAGQMNTWIAMYGFHNMRLNILEWVPAEDAKAAEQAWSEVVAAQGYRLVNSPDAQKYRTGNPLKRRADADYVAQHPVGSVHLPKDIWSANLLDRLRAFRADNPTPITMRR